MSSRHLLLALWLCALPSLSVAAEDDPVPVHGFEDMSCGAWVKSQKNEAGRAQYLYWFRGFVSGYNYRSTTKQVALGAMPNQETLSLYIDNYCREHPLHPFVGAAFDLVKELATKK